MPARNESHLDRKLRQLGLSPDKSQAKQPKCHFKLFFPRPPHQGVEYRAAKLKDGYNFVGLVLGHGGATLQRIQRQTGTKVEIHDQAGNLNGSHPDPNNPTLHALISADCKEKLVSGVHMVAEALQPTNTTFEPLHVEVNGSALLKPKPIRETNAKQQQQQQQQQRPTTEEQHARRKPQPIGHRSRHSSDTTHDAPEECGAVPQQQQHAHADLAPPPLPPPKLIQQAPRQPVPSWPPAAAHQAPVSHPRQGQPVFSSTDSMSSTMSEYGTAMVSDSAPQIPPAHSHQEAVHSHPAPLPSFGLGLLNDAKWSSPGGGSGMWQLSNGADDTTLSFDPWRASGSLTPPRAGLAIGSGFAARDGAFDARVGMSTPARLPQGTLGGWSPFTPPGLQEPPSANQESSDPCVDHLMELLVHQQR